MASFLIDHSGFIASVLPAMAAMLWQARQACTYNAVWCSTMFHCGALISCFVLGYLGHFAYNTWLAQLNSLNELLPGNF